MRPRIGALALFALVAGLAGCGSSAPEACVPTREPVTDASGEAYRCTAAEDCPRFARVSVCVTDTGVQEECVRCLDTRCVRILTPETC